jgi:Zn-dependent alcohol dehydrogenase
VKAAVVNESYELVIEDLEVPEPGPGEVLVRLVATGVCHTDLSVLQGNLPVPLPIVIGHEGAGVVERLGPGVDTVSVGDHVVCSIVVSCGECHQCYIGNLALCEKGSQVAFGGTMLDGTTRLRGNGRDYHHFFCQSSFAEYAVVPARALVCVRRDAPLETLSVLGCGAMAGIGAVMRRAEVVPGASVVVIGAGGVGLSAVMAARAVGATTIVAVDVKDEKLARAQDLGATHVVNSTTDDVVSAVMAATGRGADYAFDAVGNEATLGAAFQSVRPGGDVVAIGLTHIANTITIDIFSLLLQKRLTGTYAGSITPRVDIPAAVDLFMDGRLPLDKLISSQYKLDELPQAYEDLEAGRIGRGVVVF